MNMITSSQSFRRVHANRKRLRPRVATGLAAGGRVVIDDLSVIFQLLESKTFSATNTDLICFRFIYTCTNVNTLANIIKHLKILLRKMLPHEYRLHTHEHCSVHSYHMHGFTSANLETTQTPYLVLNKSFFLPPASE